MDVENARGFSSKMRSTIICVDDEKMLLNILAEQLTEWFGVNYTIEKALSAEDALEILDECRADNIDVSVVISDYIMPNMKGDELLAKIREKDERIRKIMLTGYSSIDGIVSAINNAGLYRYITKPWDSKDLMLTVLEAIKSFESEKKAIDYSKGFENLYHKYEALYREFESNFEKAIQALVCAVDVRDPLMAGHSKRVAALAIEFGKALKLSEIELKSLEHASLLHDIGKLGMKDNALNMIKGLKIYDDVVFGKFQSDIAVNIISNMHKNDPLMDGIKLHYERFDGKGPYGCKDDSIPKTAKIIGIVNFFDLFKSEMVFEKKYTTEVAVAKMQEVSGTLFEPELINHFVKLISQL